MKSLFKLTFNFILVLANINIGFADCISGNCQDGKGTYVFPNGDKYEGTWKNGKQDGKGTFIYTDGTKYVGEFKNGFRDGKGKFYNSTKDYYDGDWLNNQRSGFGIQYYEDGGSYKGEWKKGRKDGQGTQKYSDGSIYVGEWKDNFFNGKGDYKWSDGDKYSGEWKNGMRNGLGTYEWHTGSKYVGNWKDNVQDGFGTYYWAVGDVYEGEWRNNNMHGKGVLTWKSGDKYDGDWKEGFRTGTGTYWYANGEMYEGEFKEDMLNGKGTYYYKDGTSTYGIWQNDTFQSVSDEQMVSNEKTKIWAIVVGVSKYNHNKTLRYTKDDAYRFYAFLKSPEGGALPDKQIKLLIDEDATKARVLASMKQTFSQAEKNDVIIFYFAGHGISGSFLATDHYDSENMIPHTEINRIFNESRAKHKLCIADACNSGSLELAMRGDEDKLESFYKALSKAGSGTALMMSSKAEETSGEFEGLRQGVFSYYMIKGLKGDADSDGNGLITLKELFTFVKNGVGNFTNFNQNPVLYGTFDENMPLGVVLKK